MVASIILPLGTPGLAKADLGLRFYVSGVLDASGEVVDALDLEELGAGGDYRLSNLPNTEDPPTPGVVYTVTWEYPEGVGYAHSYPAPSTVSWAPPNVVAPIRETGLTTEDFDLALYYEESEPWTDNPLTAIEATVGGGDYVITGWPTDVLGAWRLVWRYAGLTYTHTWQVTDDADNGEPSTVNRFIEIRAIQRPFPFSLDEHNRHMFSSNYTALAVHPVTGWEESLVALLADSDLATPAVDTFVGLAGVTPIGDSPGPYVTVIDTGGTAPLETHDGAKLDRLSVQIIVRAADFEAGRTRALAIYDLLDGARDIVVGIPP